ncbi:hypothetical protein [Aquitalea aquatilis]|uniref:hypothetical protein n=1 Tax=Aquitalea aquatilis TaxID=1537400 RepID=UPI0010BDD63B|nr:hypothetical protein [Aquitalea aquatilis]
MSSITDFHWLESISHIAAPAGLSIGTFLYILRDVVAKNIFPNLTKQQAFRIILFVVFSAWTMGLASIAAWVYVTVSNSSGTTTIQSINQQQSSSAISASATTTNPPLSMDMLRNLTYKLDGEIVTLQDGKREFTPETDNGLNEHATAVFLTDHAFGDLNGHGSNDAITVLQKSDGGSAINYFLAAIFNKHGMAEQHGEAYFLGDRVDIKSISIQNHIVTVQLMMHGPNDPLCCATQFRILKFALKGETLQCTTEPCSEI